MVSVADIVKEKVMNQLDEGKIPWEQPTDIPVPKNAVTGRRYTGINRLLLRDAGMWTTFRNAQELGGSVKKGEKSTIAVFWKIVENENKPEDDYPVLRYYRMFSSDQTEGCIYPEHAETPKLDPESVASSLADKIRYGDAKYDEKRDIMRMPSRAEIRDDNEYFRKLFKVAVSWTGHPDRLNRDRFKNVPDKFSMENLIVEIGSAFMATDTGIPPATTNKTKYCENWKKVIEGMRSSSLVTAISQAQKACDYLFETASGVDEE